jgi:nucleotide-binding universal stress UspA family protein
MFKDILLPAMAGDPSDAAVDSACALAQATDGRVIALVAVSVFVPNSAEWIRYPLATYTTLHQAAADALAEQMRNVEARLGRQTVPHEVLGSHGFWLTPEEVLATYAHAVDVIVLDGRNTQDDRGRRLFAGALTASGRPVLLVPAAQALRTQGRVLVAWKDSAEATHALHDALPLLRMAKRVEVVVVGPSDETAAAPAEGCARLLEHLGRHGIEATLAQVPRAGTTGATIARHAIDSRADLIVAGGYSRPRALQQVFGGVTRHLMEHSPVPVLFSH